MRRFLLACGTSAVVAGPSPAQAQDGPEAQAPIATRRAAPANGDAAPQEAGRGAALTPDPFAWLRDARAPEAAAWREQEAGQVQRWLAVDKTYPTLLREAASAAAGDSRVQLAAGRVFVGDASGGATAWRSRLLEGAPAGEAGWRAEPALAPAGDTAPGDFPALTCDPRTGRSCVILRRGGSGLQAAGYDLASGELRPSAFRLPEGGRSAVLDGRGALLVVVREGEVSTVRRVSAGEDGSAAPVLFRSQPGETVTPGAGVGAAGEPVSWLAVEGADGASTLRIEAEGEFRRFAAPPGSEIVGVVGDQLVVQLRRGWPDAADLPPGSLLGFDLQPLLKRAPELTPHRILALTDAPDVRRAVATRSGLLLVVHEGAADVVYLCDPSLRGWAVRKLPQVSAEALELAAADAAGDAVLLRSRSFPEGERTFKVSTRSGLVDPALPDRAAFAGRPSQAFQAVALDQSRIGYTLFRAKGAASAPAPVLLLASPRDAREEAALRTLGSLWLEHGGALAVAGRRGRRYDPQNGFLDVLLSYEDLSAIGRDLVTRGLAREGRLSLAGYRSSASTAAVDLVRHPSQWSAAALIDPVTDPLRAPAAAAEPWARTYAGARETAARATWRRVAPYDNLRAGGRYAPALLVRTPAGAKVFDSDAARFTARLNEAGGNGLFVEAADDARACALAVAFLVRLVGG